MSYHQILEAKMLARKLKINGRYIPIVSSQMIFDFSDLDMYVTPPELPKKKDWQKCECGAWAVGVEKFMPGHSEYCPVNENKTPIT